MGEAEDALYVHLADDGGIFAVWGDTGREAWITEATLELELERLKARGGDLLYSRDAPDHEPPAIVERTFRRIADAAPPSIRLLAEAHPSASFPGGATTLMAAARAGDVEVLRDLVRRGAELEAQDEDGYTALMYAANAGEHEAADELVVAGADVDARDNGGSTPLMFAAQGGHAENRAAAARRRGRSDAERRARPDGTRLCGTERPPRGGAAAGRGRRGRRARRPLGFRRARRSPEPRAARDP
jgi:hypothetical protein